MTKRFLLVIAILLYFTVPVAAEGPKAGEVIYNNNCAKCHGKKGAGSVLGNGPPLVHKIYEPNHHGDASFHMAVVRGVRAHHWSFGNMPRIEGVNKDQVNKIIKYIRGLQKEAGIF
ncbi:MAG: cytochrome c [Thermodesulfobacteriota bacterium]